jgi:hypothetical protein
MRRLGASLAVVVATAMMGGGAAQVHSWHLGKPVGPCWLIAHRPAAPAAQAITVVNQAKVTPEALCRVELAVEDQALQLRAAWGTPPITFGDGGWQLYLKTGAFGFPHGEHDWLGQPYLLVWTGGYGLQGWSSRFSHEIVETLVDPQNTYVYRDGVGMAVEVADPVADQGYSLEGVYVSDFVFPAWFAGATTDPVTCTPAGCDYGTQVLAPTDSPGPWDQMRTLTSAG